MRSRSAKTTILLALLAALAGVVPADGRPGSSWPVVESRLPGFALSYPPGWHAVVRRDHSVVISSWRIARPDLFPKRPPRAIYLFVHDYGDPHPVAPFPPRPRRLRLPPPQSYEGFGHGSLLSFSQTGHSFQVFVAFGTGAGRQLRRRALEIVASLHPTRPPLANDREALLLGRSERGRPIRAYHLGDFSSKRRVLVIGCIHGTECAGIRITQVLAGEPTRANLWVIHDLSPDGLHEGTRTNADGVDLNRNFANGWRRIGMRGSPQYSGPRPFSERETRIVRNLIERIHPQITIWYHQHADLVRAFGRSIPTARRYARLSGLRFRRMRWLAGTAPNWQNHHFPGTSSFVVELPPGTLTRAAAIRHARAVLGLAAG